MPPRVALGWFVFVTSCGAGAVTPFRDAPVVWRDEDRRAFAPMPSMARTGLGWDALDQMLLAPLARLTAFEPATEAWNVNALDEVPSSSWFDAERPPESASAHEVARGPCRDALESDTEWTVISGKPDGDNPGFVARLRDGRRFLLKFDSMGHVRATTADVVASRLLHALGYHVPCNRIVFVQRERLAIAPGATVRDSTGERTPLTPKHVRDITARAERDTEGRLRAAASELLPGLPLGPFRYEGTRDDDPNDVIPHEHRRELRALRLACAWLGRTDAREANTLDTFIRDASDGRGHVEHHLLDFGDALGSVWEPPDLGRRIGESAYVDLPDIFADWLTLGAIVRPWEARRFGPFGATLGYFDVDHFVPERWTPGYDNPAMVRMTERDASWMARRLARIDAVTIEAVVDEAHIVDPRLARELVRVIEGRRRRLVARYLPPLASLGIPTIRLDEHTDGAYCVCVRELPQHREGAAPRAWAFEEARAQETLPVRLVDHAEGGRSLCIELVRAPSDHPRPAARRILALSSGSPRDGTLRIHLVEPESGAPRVVGLERVAAVQSD